MKLTSKIFAGLASIAIPSLVFAHPGHVSDESMHGFLHAEHVVILIAVLAIVYLVRSSGR